MPNHTPQYHVVAQKEINTYSPELINFFETMYYAAKEKNDDKIDEMIEEGICLGVFPEAYGSPIRVLAEEGDVKSVDFLMEKFGGGESEAIQGYAQGYHKNKVNELLQRDGDKDKDSAIRGYAIKNHSSEVKKLIQAGGNPEQAMMGYVIGGFDYHVDELQQEYKIDLSAAIFGYALVGNFKKVNSIIEMATTDKDKKNYINCAAQGFACGGYPTKVNELISQGANTEEIIFAYKMTKQLYQNLFYLLSLAPNDAFKQILIKNAIIKQTSFDKNLIVDEKLVNKASKLNSLIAKVGGLTFHQAQSYFLLAANGWLFLLFQGQQLVRSKSLHAETYFHIISYLAGCSTNDAVCIFNEANLRLKNRVIQFFSTQNVSISKDMLVKQAEKNYLCRKINF